MILSITTPAVPEELIVTGIDPLFPILTSPKFCCGAVCRILDATTALIIIDESTPLALLINTFPVKLLIVARFALMFNWISLYEAIVNLFDQLHEKNVSEGYVDFSGGGDSGDCNGFAYGDFEGRINLDDKIVNFIYEQLENHMGGWEINEGSQGRFIFNNESKDVTLDFSENREEEVPISIDFLIKF